MASSTQPYVERRIIIHGGAGNLDRTTIPKERYDAYRTSLLGILKLASEILSEPGATALDVATYAVSLLEDDPLYNSGKGAVFTRAGTQELESSIMVSNGYRKRGIGCILMQHVKNPIKLARELLIRGEHGDGDGSKDHCQYSGPYLESLAKGWGLEIVDADYFFTQNRWDEHKRGLAEEHKRREEVAQTSKRSNSLTEWEKSHYIPQGTCGAVVLDSFGTVCVATSTGGLTNKLPGRIGDTPTLGAGFWAEEWHEDPDPGAQMSYKPQLTSLSSITDNVSRGDLGALLQDCLPSLQSSTRNDEASTGVPAFRDRKPASIRHAVAMSGTGNGDAFIRMAAVRTVAAKSRFASTSLTSATTWMVGPGGELQKSAEGRWGRGHEATGGIIGIELVGSKGKIVWDYNCGGMFRAWVDDDGSHQCLIFREDDYDNGPADWNEGMRLGYVA
ncbi:N-terminal nucleophile aminohydrolase [Lophiostoma macrostomum CBS 122681]|uniref:N-terminal nucleophile aminohydrolase n=1 Tax=Lophiostoma macrostomum CBS 122681 TaxID=1314788 RepID=A0A6A6SU23_9PLEO|nr:N-terminal nucleophile aminohydrolase [Lophiostoma macrostomum CBS 122681]